MKIQQFIPKEHVFVDFPATDKQDFLRQAAQKISNRFPTFDPDTLLELFLERERTMTTGIGQGIAIPHVMYDRCTSHAVFVFKLARPIAFDALDGQPVSLAFVMIGAASPSNIVNLQILAKLALLTKRANFIRELMAAKDADELYGVLLSHD